MNRIITVFLLILSFQKTHAQPDTLKRPQTPKPPYTYISEDVEYDNEDKSIHFGATLTYPKTGKNFAVAVMITGSGLQDRDETLFDHKPFAVIANYLTQQGIAVLRVDDRMKGKTTGNVKTATSMDFANDVMASIQYVQTRKEIDKQKIGVIGHSEGGFIAPMVYTKFPQLAFIISLAGMGISGYEIALKQTTEMAKKDMIKPAFDAYFDYEKQSLDIIKANAYSLSDSSIIELEKECFVKWKKSLPDSIIDTLKMKNVTPKMIGFQFAMQLKPWTKYYLVTEPSTFWEKVQCPVLALNGQKDMQVDAEANIKAITNSLIKAGNKKVETKIFPNLNHLFQHCKKCSVEEYKTIEETFAPEVLSYMATWLKKTIK